MKDRVIESAKEESKSASLSKLHPSQQQQQQPPFTSNSNARQGKKVDNSMSNQHMINMNSVENNPKISKPSSKQKKDVRPLSGGI